MSEKIAMFKGLVLNLSLGVGKMTSKQVDYVVEWAKNNVSKIHFNKLAEIAWQYNQDGLKEELQKIYKEYIKDLQD